MSFIITAYNTKTRKTDYLGVPVKTEHAAIKNAVKLWREKTNPVPSDKFRNTEAKIREQGYYIQGFVKFCIKFNKLAVRFVVVQEERIGFDEIKAEYDCLHYCETEEEAVDYLVELWKHDANDELGGKFLRSNVEQTGHFIHDGISYSVTEGISV